MRSLPRAIVAVVAVVMTATACETKKSSNPLSPTLAGPIPGVNISAPKPLEPSHGSQVVQGTPVTLLFENAATNGERPIWQQLEIAMDAEFAQRVHYVERMELGPNGRTSYRVPVNLDGGKAYYWRARALDGANTGPFSPPVLFSVNVPARIEAPVSVSPIAGVTLTDPVPTLVVRNTALIGITSPVTVRFELARDTAFTQMVAIWSVPRSGGETTSVTGSALPLGQTFFWRANASDGALTSAYSVTHGFITPAPAPAPEPPPPAPGPDPGPNPSPSGNCPGASPLSIVECQRRQFPGRMSDAQLAQFLRAVARNLNGNGVGGGPYGVLRKPGGTNCGGYSCDIICAGQGGGQRQWDVLGDIQGAQSPMWSGPIHEKRVDVCEIP